MQYRHSNTRRCEASGACRGRRAARVEPGSGRAVPRAADPAVAARPQPHPVQCNRALRCVASAHLHSATGNALALSIDECEGSRDSMGFQVNVQMGLRSMCLTAQTGSCVRIACLRMLRAFIPCYYWGGMCLQGKTTVRC